MTEVTLREPGPEEAEQIAALLNEDRTLRADLGIEGDAKLTPEEILQEIADWCAPRRATTFAIISEGRAVGTISLSHRNPETRSARIGYWVGSRHRRRGVATAAMAEVLARAAGEGIVSVSATVAVDNRPSRRLWERFGGVADPGNDATLRYRLDPRGCDRTKRDSSGHGPGNEKE